MQKVFSIFIVACIVLVFEAVFCGCSPQKTPGVYVSEGGKPISAMTDRDVIVSINGSKIRKRDFLRCQRLQTALFELVNAKEADLKAKAAAFAKANEQRIVPMLMQNEFLKQAAADSGIKVSQGEIEEMAKVLLPAFGLKSVKIKDVVRELGEEERDTLINTVEAEALGRKTVRLLARDGWFKISAAEVTNQMEYVRKFNDNADTMNKRAKKTLLKAKAEILGGALFADVAKKYSELHPGQGKHWQTIELPELSAEGEIELRNWLAKAEMGDISDPIDLDDGISIVGVARKGPGESPPGVEPPILYTLVRCTMLARQNMQVADEKETIELIRNAKAAEARKEVGFALHKKAVIEFPNGTNFFSTATNAQ